MILRAPVPDRVYKLTHLGSLTSGVVPTEGDASGTSCEVLISVDGEVLFVQGEIGDDLVLSLSNNWENVCLSIIIFICAYSQVHLLCEFVFSEESLEGQKWICWCLFDVCKFVLSELSV